MVCRLCPRACGTDRAETPGACGADERIRVARAAPHYWEEPCISGASGSGTVFFSGCALHCVYCQNRKISDGGHGKVYTEDGLYRLFQRLAEQGVHNINLVTPDHYLPQLLPVLRRLKAERFKLPVLMNCSGYETAAMLQPLEGLVDIYMPDFKYASPLLALKYSSAPDYPAVAEKAVAEMVRQQPECIFDGNGMLLRGVLVRHLVLPGQTADSEKVLAKLYSSYGDRILYSIMSQFTPFGLSAYPELDRKVTKEEYARVVGFARALGITNAYIQEGDAAKESFIPDFTDTE